MEAFNRSIPLKNYEVEFKCYFNITIRIQKKKRKLIYHSL